MRSLELSSLNKNVYIRREFIIPNHNTIYCGVRTSQAHYIVILLWICWEQAVDKPVKRTYPQEIAEILGKLCIRSGEQIIWQVASRNHGDRVVVTIMQKISEACLSEIRYSAMSAVLFRFMQTVFPGLTGTEPAQGIDNRSICGIFLCLFSSFRRVAQLVRVPP